MLANNSRRLDNLQIKQTVSYNYIISWQTTGWTITPNKTNGLKKKEKKKEVAEEEALKGF